MKRLLVGLGGIILLLALIYLGWCRLYVVRIQELHADGEMCITRSYRLSKSVWKNPRETCSFINELDACANSFRVKLENTNRYYRPPLIPGLSIPHVEWKNQRLFDQVVRDGRIVANRFCRS